MKLVFLSMIMVCFGALISHATTMNEISERYVRLVLAVGEHDSSYVDAFYGPEKWKEQAKAEHQSLDQIRQSAEALLKSLGNNAETDPMLRLRHEYLFRQIQALISRVDLLIGKKFTFDEESKALYDAVSPAYDEEHYRSILKEIDKLLPGEGTLQSRYEKYRQKFIIPAGKLDSVFQAAIAECKRRTRQHIQLPENENFKLEYVTNKPWSGYNWYQGNFQSLIQVNTDLPIYVDRAIDLACHEGYPGHHVYNVMLEQHLVKDRGWIEFMVYPLYSPQSFIAEGSANFGIQVAFPGPERIAFEEKVLFPLAGITPSTADTYYHIQDLVQELQYAPNDAARQYLDGKITKDQAAKFLTDFNLMTMDQALKRVSFIDHYRSYVINYNLGQDLVKRYIESQGGTSDHPEKRWEVFKELISSPRLPSGLTK